MSRYHKAGYFSVLTHSLTHSLTKHIRGTYKAPGLPWLWGIKLSTQYVCTGD